ncbi:hypothetical protein Ga0466249_005304 [Sporomusaceae bacterium BoRhaA]|uniref:hypothetical protein n=1 Tax=Pelorhabdus rhamnosifermentans TaxID=2772457 RepID=UPI001C0601B5|nr:hypothetical protein [Pelorhabdus rhamnosifermentans]MBU2704150.1 hypothetical protein [Pelorhabdus rhamnosifermentans]
MNVKMKVNGKTEFQNGTNITTNLNLIPVNDSTSTTQINGSLTITTTDQPFADSVNFRDVLTVDIEAVGAITK